MRRSRTRWPGLPVRFLRLDMDRDFVEQGLAPGSADVLTCSFGLMYCYDARAAMTRPVTRAMAATAAASRP